MWTAEVMVLFKAFPPTVRSRPWRDTQVDSITAQSGSLFHTLTCGGAVLEYHGSVQDLIRDLSEQVYAVFVSFPFLFCPPMT